MKTFPHIEARLKALGYLKRKRQSIIMQALRGSPKHLEWIKRIFTQRHLRSVW